MGPKLKISSFVIKRLEKVKSQCSGCLFGLMYDGQILILGFNVEHSSTRQGYKKIQNNFPAELDLFGIIKFGDCTDAQAHLNDILQDIDVTDNPILLHSELESSQGLRASLFKHGQLEDISFEIMSEEELLNDFCYTRIECNLNVMCNEDESSVRTAMQELRKHLASGKTGFNIKHTQIYLTGGESGTSIVGINSSAKIGDLINTINAASNDSLSHGKSASKKKLTTLLPTEFDVIKVIVMKKLTNDIATDSTLIANNRNSYATRCIVNPTIKTKIPLQIDGMAMLYRGTFITGLYDILIESLCRSIRLIENSVIAHKFLQTNGEVGVPKTFNFLPNDLGHFFSVVYFSESSDADPILQKHRRKLHSQFDLKLNRPQFRRANRYAFKDDDAIVNCKYLINPHVGLKPALGSNSGRQYIVNGKYTYYHYMQDNFDDNGWGCAYRSLQTLCSWFRWQGYTERTVPTHREIQKYLVDIGDKSSAFIGSKQWIGSTEVGMCLDGFMNIVSRILRVETGAELSQHGPTLVRHFETQGTPIMIGGGVLAHTILGVDFNSTTNELKFLILDPHYTGADDLQIVQSKRWCGWKGCDFWDKKSYYNLCMPQLPTIECY